MVIEVLRKTRTAHVPEPTARIHPREYAHIVLKTTQPQAMIEWYCKVLGMSVVMETPIINFLTWDDSQDRLAIITVKPDAMPLPGRTGFHHVAFTYDRLAETVEVYKTLKAEGILPHWCVNHGVATSFYYHDPDGNSVELSVENFPDRNSLNDWLATSAFNLNPVGVTLDADTLVSRLDSGEDERSILRPHPGHIDGLQAELDRAAKSSSQ